jgi:F-type H+-transporting ATPase subunit epsilon
MAETLELEIVTPERLVVHEKVEEVQIPGRSGYLGVLPGHAPLITELGVGEITFRNGGVTTRLAVAWGFAEVLANKVTILAETSERANEIDVARALQAKQRAEEILRTQAADTNYDEVQGALKRAETRIEVAEKGGR